MSKKMNAKSKAPPLGFNDSPSKQRFSSAMQAPQMVALSSAETMPTFTGNTTKPFMGA